MIWSRRHNHVFSLYVSQGDTRFVLTLDHWRKIAEFAREIAASDARVVLLRSPVPGIFNRGADLIELAGNCTDSAGAARFRELMRAAVDALAALPVPVIAVVDGQCYGAAVALTLACDLCIVGKDARFGITPARLGLGYPREDVARLVARVGRGQAARLMFTGETIDAQEALRIGLADLYAPKCNVFAEGLAASIAANAPNAVRLLKRTLDAPSDRALDAAFDQALGGAEFAEGASAFALSRPANYG